jgi:Putative auto-transporter adhesin, head GIN domain
MKKVVIMLAAAAAMLSFYSCKKVIGEGPVQTENRAINNFTGIVANFDGTIYFTQSPSYKVEIKAQRNIIDIIETYKIGNELIVKFRNNLNVSTRKDIIVNISAPSVESLHLSGSGNIFMQGNFTAPQFNTGVSGSGSISADNLQIVNKLTAYISGSGSLKAVTGAAKTKDVVVSGSGNIDLSGIIADAVDARVSGSGTVKVNAVQILDATVSGSGTVRYLGNPVITTHISGSGKVVRL